MLFRSKVKEVEKKWRELEEAEIKWLEGVKKQLEEEKRVEEQHVAELRSEEGAVEWRRVALAAPSPEAGPSRVSPWQPKWIAKGANCGGVEEGGAGSAVTQGWPE